jgi:hypothetical protein
MFVALVLTVCLVSNQSECKDQELLFESHGSLMQCMFEAPPYIAEWTVTHPNWKVTRWRCAAPGQDGNRT